MVLVYQEYLAGASYVRIGGRHQLLSMSKSGALLQLVGYVHLFFQFFVHQVLAILLLVVRLIPQKTFVICLRDPCQQIVGRFISLDCSATYDRSYDGWRNTDQLVINTTYLGSIFLRSISLPFASPAFSLGSLTRFYGVVQGLLSKP